jgi:hypothetical protein
MATGRRRGQVVGRVLALGTLVGAGALGVVAGTVGHPAVAGADGPAPCTAGPPPDPFHGFCATYSGRNTWYGSYGPGFPTNLGWGFCAENAASGGDYPVPGDGYQPGGAPPGADLSGIDPLGFALSQAQADGWWDGVVGQFTADQAAVAGKLLYDQVVWHEPLPAMDPGVLAAYDDLDGLVLQAAGITAVPTLSLTVLGGGTTFGTSATVHIQVDLPGTGHGFAGLGLLLSVTGATWNGPGGPGAIGVATDGSGGAQATLVAAGPYPVQVTAAVATQVGHPGLGFYHPTGDPAAQDLAAVPNPSALSATLQLTATGPAPAPGRITVEKAVDDGAYYGPGGAVFQIRGPGGQVEASLTTDGTGATAPSPPLAAPATYTVHEAQAPPGYRTAPDQTVTLAPGSDTTVYFSGAEVERAVPATITQAKADGGDGAPLDGAVFDVRYDQYRDGTFGDDLGHCTTTGPTGTCQPAGNDGGALRPGEYQVTEVSPPPGYGLDPVGDTRTVLAAPGQHLTLTFDDFQGSLQIHKAGDDPAYLPVAGAVFTVTGPAPSTAVAGTLTVGADGTSGVLAHLAPGTYTVTETTPPPGYAPVAPLQVAVAAGPTVTTVDVLDRAVPATATLHKVDLASGAPLAGAVLDVRAAPVPGGPYSTDLGTCTTDAAGVCAPPGNDGPGLYPGDYQVTEVAAPPGYAPPGPGAVQDLTLAAGQAGSAVFRDPLLVPASFQKAATGNADPATVVLAGAALVVTADSPTGPAVAGCTTDVTGACRTAPVLQAGSPYCWHETAAPPGLAPSASGCFTARDDQGTLPIAVADPGLFVAVAARKVDRADGAPLAGAVLDLYREDGGHGPDHPVPPDGAATLAGATWVARATSGTDGRAAYPLQFPGFAYCVVEAAAPADYDPDPDPVCSPVLRGTTAVPPTLTVLTLSDTRATAVLTAQKFNALAPGTAVPGAVYDLYAEGPGPGGPPPARPTDPPPLGVPGDTWRARGTSGPDGLLRFSVPAGFAWCLREVSAPPDYQPDTGLHCSAVLGAGGAGPAPTVALPEVRATVHLAAHKFNALQPDTDIPGATYELVSDGPAPPGTPGPAPAGWPVPAGDTYWARGTSGPDGVLTFAVPAGYAWCLHETAAPPGYRPDAGFHCTAVLTADSPATAATVALPETPSTPPPLAFTGLPLVPLAGGGAVLVLLGTALVVRRGRRRSDAGSVPLAPVSAAAAVALSLSVAGALTLGPVPVRAAAPGWAPVAGLPVPAGQLVLGVGCTQSTCVAVGGDPAAGSTGHPSPPLVLHSADGGATWTAGRIPAVPTGELTSVTCPTPTRCLALGSSGDPTLAPPGGPGAGLLLVSDDGGATWSPEAGAPTVPVLDGFKWPQDWIACPGPDRCLLGGDQPYFSADGGTTWTAGSLPAGLPALGEVNGVPDVPALGEGQVSGLLSCPSALDCALATVPSVRTTDGGATWQISTAPLSSVTGSAVTGGLVPSGLSCAAGGQCVAVGTLAGSTGRLAVGRSVDGGGTWTVSALPTVTDPAGSALSEARFPGVACAGTLCSVLAAMATPSGGGPVSQVTFTSTDGGATWAPDDARPGPAPWVALLYATACAPTRCLAAAAVGSAAAGAGGLLTLPLPASAPACGPAGTLTLSAVSGDGQSVPLGTLSAPLVVRVSCAPGTTGAVPPGAAVTWLAVAGTSGAAGAPTRPSTLPGAGGLASTTARADDLPGPWTVLAQVSGAAPVTFHLTNVACTPVLQPGEGGGQHARVGRGFARPLTARVTCAGAPLPGAAVTYRLPGGPGGTFPGSQSTAGASADGSGTATSPPVTADAVPGDWRATASLTVAAGPAGADPALLPLPAGMTAGRDAAVSCPTAQWCAAAGLADGPGSQAPVVALRADGSWVTTTLPSPPGRQVTALDALSCPEPGACTAVGEGTVAGGEAPLAWTLAGGAWTVAVVGPPPGTGASVLEDVTCTPTGGCLAVGQVLDPVPHALVATGSGSGWTTAVLDEPVGTSSGALDGVACPSAGSCWAVGQAAGPRPLVATGPRDDASAWTETVLPVPSGLTGAALTGVACPGPGCTAVGDGVTPSGSAQGLSAAQEGGTWTMAPVPVPPGSDVVGLACPVPAGCVAAGGSPGGGGAFAARQSPAGWLVTDGAGPPGAAGAVLARVTCPGTDHCLGVGTALVDGAPRPFVTDLSLPPAALQTVQFGLTNDPGPGPALPPGPGPGQRNPGTATPPPAPSPGPGSVPALAFTGIGLLAPLLGLGAVALGTALLARPSRRRKTSGRMAAGHGHPRDRP